ncbi:beta-galactoside-binding lectin isoform X2 [Oryzias melastigma]|uniref:beta-galactoside-binding lectin isoform X2 n=1 Tax=Oryzias melastigma TaxID=30732 RepID=UPI000CF83325|nr:beta-galactoside-binding lectin isoform X2 [Oryzias melastigma]
MQNMVIQNMSFRVGQSLAIVGNIKPHAVNFSVNVGHNSQSIALHLNPRFNAFGDTNAIVCNSYQQGKWQQEVRPGGFCFFRGENFKLIIKLTSMGFVVTLPNGCQISFPNRLGSGKYNYFSFNGDVRIKSFEIY